MTITDFKDLLRRYLDGQSTEAELRLIDTWYDALNEDVTYQFTPAEQARLKARMWAQIEERTVPEGDEVETPILPLPVRRQSVAWFQRRSWQVAASLLLLAGVGWFGWQARNDSSADVLAFQGDLATASAGMPERHNATDKPITLRLPDGSTVYLTPHSTLRMATTLATGERVVYLAGDAFFSIAKNPHRPFRVVTDQVETQVLGTSFWVHAAGRANQVDVEVVTGKVQVYERTRQAGSGKRGDVGRGVVLTPNQMVTITDKEHWQTGLIAQPVPIKPELASESTVDPVTSLTFSDVPLTLVCQRLTKLYGIELDLANIDLASCTFSGDLSRQSLYTQLDLICTTINARYDVRGTHILISGRGCSR
ncbi:FecR family protein [uncultured Fibrella sp.]|uniref:FecR family protein n=1 Tax=uncultured Fibrella sp. TaxID=1284596 RepID=UPI0035CA7955